MFSCPLKKIRKRQPVMNLEKLSPQLPKPAKKSRFNLFDEKLATGLDVAKVSDHGAAVVVMPVLHHLVHDPI